VPEFGVAVRGITQKNNNFTWSMDSEKKLMCDLGGGLRPFGVFPNENDYRLHSHLGMHTKILKASFVFFIGANS